MAIFVNIDERVLVLILVVVAFGIWAVVYPESFSNSVDTVVGIITGAIDGARGAA